MKDSAIAWTHHTFNPWWGCAQVSPGCAHCYAKDLAHRYQKDVWATKGDLGHRKMMSADYWKQPARWNREAEASGVTRRVFCASMADVFEEHPEVSDARKRLWDVINATPYLDWLLLTKRPENVIKMAPWHGLWPDNIWLGTSVENQYWADQRIPHLFDVCASVRFLSCEPLLGPVNLRLVDGWDYLYDGIDWVIVGGESGLKHRPLNLDWARKIRDDCDEMAVPFFFKQIGGKTSRSGGHLLDGIEHFNYPDWRAA